MLGAIIGDIVGSRFEWDNYRAKDFEFFTYKCFPTDDTVMTLALAQAILVSKPDYSDLSQNAVDCMQRVGRNYPDCGYGGGFYHWMFSDEPKPYNSFGNGAAMRVSAAGFAAKSLEEAKMLSEKVTAVTHGIPSDIRKHALNFLDERLMQILIMFENKYPPVMEKKIGDVIFPS